jgi:hypothetical protein
MDKCVKKLFYSLFSIFCLLFYSGHAKILMKPYLQAVTTNSIYVMVECDSQDKVTVNFGVEGSLGLVASTTIVALTNASPATYVHKVKLDGLNIATKYFYQAHQGDSQYPVESFTTAVGEGTPFRFTWMADFRTGVKVHDSIAALMLEAKSVISLYGGDLCMNSSYDLWKTEFFRRNQLDLISRVPFYNTPGNHEGWSDNAKAFTQNPESLSGTQDYYSFDYGDLHVLSINYLLPYDAKSSQYKFAQEDLARTKKKWKIVICHAPAYCEGGHGDDKKLISMTKKVFKPLGVNAVIAGHTHFYQHNFVDGLHHLIIGSAGAPLYSPGKGKNTVYSARKYNWAVGEVTPDRLVITVYNEKNEFLDKIEIQ